MNNWKQNSGYSADDIMAMQKDAIARVKEMQRRANSLLLLVPWNLKQFPPRRKRKIKICRPQLPLPKNLPPASNQRSRPIVATPPSWATCFLWWITC